MSSCLRKHLPSPYGISFTHRLDKGELCDILNVVCLLLIILNDAAAPREMQQTFMLLLQNIIYFAMDGNYTTLYSMTEMHSVAE